MESSPIISIIIPVFNADIYLIKCIESVLNQSFVDFELILVNDGSTDNSGLICNDYSVKDLRVKVIHKKNGGVSSARNAGLDAAKGDYIGWVDADDFIAPDMFEFLLYLIQSHDADISECSYAEIKDEEVKPAQFGGKLEVGTGNFLLEKFIAGDIFYGLCTKLFKKGIFEKVRFPQERIFEDTWLTLEICLGSYKYVRDPQVKYFYNQTPGSIIRSNVSQRKAREYIYILESQLDLVNAKVNDAVTMDRLHQRIMEKSVFWYLGLALSGNPLIRNVYARVYLERMNWPVSKLLQSSKIPLKNKITFTLCRLRLGFLPYYIKKSLSKKNLHKEMIRVVGF